MKRLHLICNAHIDPIWQWGWDEGLSAAIATFKSAADLADEYDYIFCHNESLLYEEIEKNAPQLFERIRRLVKSGKWVIAGGWYVQPDCLMPSGESLVRQITTGQDYFYKKFGVKSEVAVNYDSFGHSIGLVQIMKKLGYKGYIICRPKNDVQFDYPSKFFKWKGKDGSEIAVTYSESYNSQLGCATTKITNYLNGQHNKAEIESECDVDFVLWGVGNHGGGPSRKDLNDIANLKIDGVDIKHSSPDALFNDDIIYKGEVTSSLITCMPGCYTSMSRIKRAHRETENLLYSTEKLIAAAKLCGFNYDSSQMNYAVKKFLLGEFHDILPGTVVKEGEDEGLELFSCAKKIFKEYRSAAFSYLTMNQPVAEVGEYPIFVFNYSANKTNTPVEFEFSLADQNWSDDFVYVPEVYAGDKQIPCQTIKEASMLNLDWRKRVVFVPELQPLSLNRFSVRVRKEAKKEKIFSNANINEFLSGTVLRQCVPVIYDDTADPWAMEPENLKQLGKNPIEFKLVSEQDAAKFCCINKHISPVHIIEDGDVLTSVECFYVVDGVNAAIVYTKYKNQSYVDVKVTLEFTAKNKLVRLRVPTPNGVVVGDGPYTVEEKPMNTEASFQKWVGVKKPDGKIFAIINDGIYGCKACNDYIELTLIRGAGYCFHPINDRELYSQDRYLPRIDCGRYEYRFRICDGDLSYVVQEAMNFNEKPYAVNIFPTGGETSNVHARVDGDVVTSVFKANDNGEYVFRLFNPTDTEKEVKTVVGNDFESLTVKPCEIVSVLYNGNKFTVSHDKIL